MPTYPTTAAQSGANGPCASIAEVATLIDQVATHNNHLADALRRLANDFNS
ncbi:MAG: hypothetical protein IPH82_04320 [Chloroflexi bacterium]|nr:hypothetical protein [Chloroflexota bacterium]